MGAGDSVISDSTELCKVHAPRSAEQGSAAVQHLFARHGALDASTTYSAPIHGNKKVKII